MTNSFPNIFSDRDQLKGFYRFMNNEKVTRKKLLTGYESNLVALYKQSSEVVEESGKDRNWYVIQDSLYTDYSQRDTLEGSYTQTLNNKGFIFHNGLVLNENFRPLGLLFQDVIVRDREEFGKSHDKAKRSIEEKESYKWIQGLKAGASFREKSGACLVHIMDREGDVLEVLQEAQLLGEQYVIRSVYNRNLPEEGSKLWDCMRGLEKRRIVIRTLRDKDSKLYQARCELKYKAVVIKGMNETIYAVYLKELEAIEHNRKRDEPAEWLLLSNLEVVDYASAEKVVTIYTKRWLIEEFHKCLQTGGCEIEKRQFRSDDVLLDCITFLAPTAIKLLVGRYLAKDNPDEPAESVLDAEEIEFADKLAKKYLKPVDLKECNEKTVLWVVLLISRMGGHQGIRQKGLPGYQTLWRGWFKFGQQFAGYKLAKSHFT